MIKSIFSRAFDSSIELNKKNILSFLEKNKNSRFLDLGCDDGVWTVELSKRINSDDIWGLDIIEERLREANKLKIKTVKANLNEKLPFEDFLMQYMQIR